MKPDTELTTLIYLMEDPDPVVRRAVSERLVKRGEESVEQIERFIIPNLSDDKKESIVEILEDVKADIAFENLAILLNDPQPKLDISMFLITKIADTTAVETIFFSTLESLSLEIAAEVSESKTPVENLEIFNYIFFNRFGFRHTDTKMRRIESALLDRVLLARGGNPVTVTLAYFLLANAVGLPIYPLCFPGGFVPVYINSDGAILFYLNIFKQGAIFMEDTLKQFFEDIGMVYNPDNLRVEQERSLLSIYAELIAFVSKNIGDEVVLERMERLIEVFGGRRHL